MGILEASKQDTIRQARYQLTLLFQAAGYPSNPDTWVDDEEHGYVIVEGQTFTYASKYLRLVQPCPRCPKDVPGQPVRCMADISDQLENFRPIPHDCVDV